MTNSNHTIDAISVGLDVDSWKDLSGDDARSLLSVFALPQAEERTYSGILMASPPSGSNLYVAHNFFG